MYKSIVIILIIFCDSCNTHTTSNDHDQNKKPHLENVIKDIPVYSKGDMNIFYRMARQEASQLNLDSLELGYDSIQIRIWYDYSLIPNLGLFVMKYSNNKWTAQAFHLYITSDGTKDSVHIENQMKKTPKSGWDNFIRNLFSLKILTLPNMDEAGMRGGLEGRTFSVEIATRTKYRFYYYWEPQQYQDKFCQAKNMENILQLIEKEFDFKRLDINEQIDN